MDAFAATIAGFRARGGKGLNVTVPFKLEACRISTRLTERAEAAEAVNTLAFDDNGILGDNTDGAGLLRDIVANLKFSLAGRRVLLMGAGGAARGVLRPCCNTSHACSLSQIVPGKERRDCRNGFRRYGTSCPAIMPISRPAFDLVINSTSASLEGKLPALPSGYFRRRHPGL